MCMFSGPVREVSGTHIFARFTDGNEQALIYEMKLSANKETAMILPLPVTVQKEDAITFVSLENYPDLFADIGTAFNKPVLAALGISRSFMKSAPLEVVKVGAYNASCVPTIKDFDRLDPQFRLPNDVWKALAKYSLYSFAVFKLRVGDSKTTEFHPMALKFQSALPGTVFFPTVHVHNQIVEQFAQFDHELYWQGGTSAFPPPMVRSNPTSNSIDGHVDIGKTHGLIGAGLMHNLSVHGTQKNEDYLIHV